MAKLHFFHTIVSSVHPKGHEWLAKRKKRHAIEFLFALVVFSLFIKLIGLIPLGFDLYDSYQEIQPEIMGKSSQDLMNQSYAWDIPSKRPLVQFYTGRLSEQQAPVLFTDTAVVLMLNGEQKEYLYSHLPTVNMEVALDKIPFLVVLFVPAALLVFLLHGLIKYFFMAFLSAFIVWAVTRAWKFVISLAKITQLAIYSTTIVVLLESIFVPLRFSAFIVPLYEIPGFTLYLIPFSWMLIVLIIWVNLVNRQQKEWM